MTPGYSRAVRQMTPTVFNTVKDHCISRGYDVILLGNQRVDNREISFDKAYDFSGCINLINQTDLLTAAHIMSHSAAVIGLDNGLVHLAAMTDATIVFGYTIAGPQKREPRRRNKNAKVFNVHNTKDELSCLFCQDNMRFIGRHNFEYCVYRDNACTKLMEKDGARVWLEAVDAALK